MEKFSYSKAQNVIGKRKNHSFQKYLFRHILNKFTRDPLKLNSDLLKSNFNEIINKLLNDDSLDEGLNIDDLLLKGVY